MAEIDGLAVLRYDTPHYEVVRAGRFVMCAESQAQIDLQDLVYWSVEFQEAYRGPTEATRSYLRHRAQPTV